MEFINNGDNIIDKSLPISRIELINLIIKLLESNNNANYSYHYQMAAVIAFDYKCVGRSNEGSAANMKCLSWNPFYNIAELSWSMSKVGRQKTINLCNDYDNFALDPYVMFGIMSMFKTVNITNKDLMFPVLTGNVSKSKISTTLQKFPEYNSYDPTSIRVGAIDTILCHQQGSIKNCVMISGHDHTNVCAIFEYMYIYPSLLKASTMILSNYPVVCSKYVRMNIDIIYKYCREVLNIDLVIVSACIYIII